ncbi:MAG: hypothetical protein IPN20_03415 [Haliscomenobacter sp.]|nr:hypothetical protein [Haliscomenobacter sp.]
MTAVVAAFGFSLAFSMRRWKCKNHWRQWLLAEFFLPLLLTLIVSPALYILFSGKGKVKGSVASVVLVPHWFLSVTQMLNLQPQKKNNSVMMQ